jgi:hypothetical protein
MNIDACNICKNLPTEIPERNVSEIPELADRLEQVAANSKNLVITYRCKECGQLWEEYFHPTGDGEVSSVRKVDARDK